jgi:protein-S-isoprenylcysteine O-methyltransferase Ste14
MDAKTGSGERDGAAVRFPPPLVPLIGLVLGIALQAFVWPLPLPLAGLARYGVAVVLLALGLALGIPAIRQFVRTGQDPAPWQSTPEIIATGIYRITRNPMYLGMGFLQAGLGVALANGWVVALVPFTWLAIYFIAIRHEEAYLERKFGNVYTDYKKSVRRWL